MNSSVTQAIKEQKIIELHYHNYRRTVEPHAYGRNSNGEEVLRCYQITGGSKSGERVGWKLLKIRDVFLLQVTSHCFIVRQDYKRGDSAMVFIFCEQ